jgi:hypothetical protein
MTLKKAAITAVVVLLLVKAPHDAGVFFWGCLHGAGQFLAAMKLR